MSTTGTLTLQLALRASVLIYIDGQPGEWISFARVCQHVGAVHDPARERVRHVLGQLTDANQVQHSSYAGTDFYGVRCEGTPAPTVSEARS